LTGHFEVINQTVASIKLSKNVFCPRWASYDTVCFAGMTEMPQAVEN
jgi:hypothetical protein